MDRGEQTRIVGRHDLPNQSAGVLVETSWDDRQVVAACGEMRTVSRVGHLSFGLAARGAGDVLEDGRFSLRSDFWTRKVKIVLVIDCIW